MRRVLACLALVLALFPARARAQYPGANLPAGTTVNPGAGAGMSPTLSVTPGTLNPAVVAPPPANFSTSPGTTVNPAVVVTPAAEIGASSSVSSVGVSPPPGGYGADQQSQAYYYLYLSVLYSMQGAYATPGGRAQIDRGVSEYFSNGAAVTAVPTSGPTAAYFTNGAQATTAPTSVMPDYTFSPPLATASPLTVEAGPPPPPPAPVEAGAPAETPTEEPTASPEALAAEPAYAPAPAYAPEATVVPAAPPPPPAFTPTPVPTATPVTPPPAPAPAALPRAPHVSPGTIVWPMIGGIAIGALLILLGTRIRPRSPST